MARAAPWVIPMRRFTRMAEASDLLLLVQWLSPAFPIGAFAYSQGLEVAISDGEIRDAATLEAWIAAVLRYGSGRMDAILLAQARAEAADLTALANLAYALAPAALRAQEMREQGRAFATAIHAMTGRAQPDLPLMLAVGFATRRLKVPTERVLALWLQGVAAQLVSVAVRFVPLGQTEGQAVLARLAPRLADWAADCAAASLADLGSASLRADLAAMRQETLEVRIFRS